MTTLDELLDLKHLEALISDGYIRRNPHPTAPLALLNYSEKAQYERFWPTETRVSRGLIYNVDTLEVVARGFPKFFNLSEHAPEEIPSGFSWLSDKFDGSLGILYLDPTSDEFKIATRGSFTSEQAHKGTEILESFYWSDKSSVEDVESIADFFKMDGVTYLFEILYPQNRIVCDYGDREELVLLDVIDNDTGNTRFDLFIEIPWPHKAVKRLWTHSPNSLSHLIAQGDEGFVLCWPENGLRVKIKSEEYVQLHRTITGLSEKSVWEMIGEGMTAEDIKENVPDELFDWVDETFSNISDQIAYIIDEAVSDYDAVIRLTARDAPVSVQVPGSLEQQQDIAREHRAIFARHTANFPESLPFLFMLLDNAPPERVWSKAWKMVKPTGDTRVWNRSDTNT